MQKENQIKKFRNQLKELSPKAAELAGKISNLTVLSYGGGQDSKTEICKFVTDPNFRARYAPGELIVVMSDTGDEHQYTLDDLKEVEKMCSDNGIEFHFMTNDKGFHIDSWPDLISPQLRAAGGKYKPTMVQLKTKSCTDKLKIGPIYKFLDEWINEKYGYKFEVRSTRGVGKQAIKKFHAEQGKIRILIGYAYDEEKRAVGAKNLEIKTYQAAGDEWQKALFREFPLIDLKLNRKACQAYVASTPYNMPKPSNCRRCPYMSDPELIWLYNNDRLAFTEWVEIENRKLKRYENHPDIAVLDKTSGVEYFQEFKNNGVFNGKKTIQERLESALEKFGHWSMAKLDEYKFSHGCSANGM